jgi:hypothetical protein
MANTQVVVAIGSKCALSREEITKAFETRFLMRAVPPQVQVLHYDETEEFRDKSADEMLAWLRDKYPNTIACAVMQGASLNDIPHEIFAWHRLGRSIVLRHVFSTSVELEVLLDLLRWDLGEFPTQ